MKSTLIETLRNQLGEQANADHRFKGAVCEALFPPIGSGPWKAILASAGGRLFEVVFSFKGGVVKLGESSREVFRSIRYLPLAARQTDAEDAIAIHAREFTSEVRGIAERWMFAPAGVHTITPAAGEGSAEITLRIDETTVPVLNAHLAKLNAAFAPQRAFIDKEHDEAAGATAWPTRFVWSDSPEPGIYIEHEPSRLGRELVEGKIIRAFSPSFYSDAELPRKIRSGQHATVAAGKRGSPENPARMTGLVFPAIGTLTNNPAFKKILPLWAKTAAGARSSANK